MPRTRNLQKAKQEKNKYGEPTWGSVTPRRLTPKTTTPHNVTRFGRTPAAIPPNRAQEPRPEVKLFKPPAGYSFLAQKAWHEYRIGQANKNKTEAKVSTPQEGKVAKKEENKKKSKNF